MLDVSGQEIMVGDVVTYASVDRGAAFIAMAVVKGYSKNGADKVRLIVLESGYDKYDSRKPVDGLREVTVGNPRAIKVICEASEAHIKFEQDKAPQID